MKKFSSKIYFLFFSLGFFLFVFNIFFSFSMAQSSDNSTRFPYKINFTTAELKFLNSLDEATLLKLISIAQNLLTKNSQTASSSQTTTSGASTNTSNSNTNTGQTNSQPTITSNSPSAQTPYYNPQTGQYQNTPANNGGQSNNPLGNLLGGSSQNPYLGNQTNNGGNPASTPGQDTSRGIETNPDLSQFNYGDIKILDICKPNFGVDIAGSCSKSMSDAKPKLQKDMLELCSLLGKRIKSQSVFRSVDCNKMIYERKGEAPTNSQHSAGTAIDFGTGGMSSAEKVKAFGFFKLKQYGGVGCYGGDSFVHFDFGPARRWGSSCPSELKQAGY